MEDLIIVKTRMRDSSTIIKPSNWYWTKIWVDCVNQYLSDRNLEIIYKYNNINRVMNNQTIMGYAIEYISEIRNK